MIWQGWITYCACRENVRMFRKFFCKRYLFSSDASFVRLLLFIAKNRRKIIGTSESTLKITKMWGCLENPFATSPVSVHAQTLFSPVLWYNFNSRTQASVTANSIRIMSKHLRWKHVTCQKTMLIFSCSVKPNSKPGLKCPKLICVLLLPIHYLRP